MDGLKMLPEAFAEWHQVQDSLSRLTDLEFSIYDTLGRPIGLVSGESPFCRAQRLKGSDSAFCEERCGKFIRDAAAGDKALFFNCSTGLMVFAVPITHEGMGTVVIAGGKTFAGKPGYDSAMEGLVKSGSKVSPTGRHRYRFIGRKKLNEAVELVRAAASQHFGLSCQKFKYQLSLNRQLALLENSALMHHDREMPDLAENLLRCIRALFDADTASLHVFGVAGEAYGGAHYRGKHEEALRQAGDGFTAALKAMHKVTGESFRTADKGDVGRLCLPGDIASIHSFPFYSSNELSGAVSLFNTDVSPEDMPALRACIQQVASLVDNRRLRDEVGEKIKGLKAVADMNAGMGALRDAEEIFSFIFEKSAELLQAEQGSLMLLNDKTEELMVKVSKGMSDEMRQGLRLKPGEGIAGWVAAAGTPIIVEDMENDARLSIKKRPRYRTKSFISLPLKVEGRIIGVLNFSDKITGRVFNQDDLQMLSGLASQAAVAIERGIFHERNEVLKRVSIKDPLTGLLNWHYFNDRLIEEMDRSRRYGRPFCLAVIALDGFKAYIKKFGREEVDGALKGVSSLLRGAIRTNDILARYGEEEFTLLLPETGIDNSCPLTERIRKSVEDSRFGATDGGAKAARLTVTIGLSEFPKDGEDLKSLFVNAYSALSSARENGGNRVATYQADNKS